MSNLTIFKPLAIFKGFNTLTILKSLEYKED